MKTQILTTLNNLHLEVGSIKLPTNPHSTSYNQTAQNLCKQYVKNTDMNLPRDDFHMKLKVIVSGSS